MSFEPRSFDEIVGSLQERSAPAITDFEIGSVARTLYESFAYEIGLLYEKMNLVYLSAFIDTAEDQQLDMVVAALGIRRGQPDFATGVVSFQRDVGNTDIEIPINTLISTEETENRPSKIYQTAEPAVLSKDSVSVDVKVQAVLTGEAQATESQTITVMPRPIPGIKGVINRDAVRFTGKRRETDPELRTRAKNALIASGKSTIVSLEDGLLSLPKVKDVRVRENFHFARGQVKIAQAGEAQSKDIEKHFRLMATSANGVARRFEIRDSISIADNASEFVNIQALDAGHVGEVQEGESLTWTLYDHEGNLVEDVYISNAEPILLRDFGIVEIYVDGIDFKDKADVRRVEAEIERLRAAGVFVILKEVTPVIISGIFKISLDESLRLPADDRVRIENRVANAIRSYIAERRMGQPLVMGQIIKNALRFAEVENLDDFTLTVTRNNIAITHGSNIRREEIEEFERINPGYICVASEIKALPINIQFLAVGLNEDNYAIAITALESYFKTLGPGKKVVRELVIRALREGTDGLDETSLQLTPQPWCEHGAYTGQDIAVSFVELPQIGNVFGYSALLDVIGAVRLTLPSNMSDAAKAEIAAQVKQLIEEYIDALKPEANIVFSDIIALARQVESVLAVDINHNDFSVNRNNQPVEGRVVDDKVEIQSFEKATATYIGVTSRIETLQIELNNLEINLYVAADGSDVRDLNTIVAESQESVINALRNAYANFIMQPEAGRDVSYAAFRRALQVTLPDVSYSIENFSLKATSMLDKWEQVTPQVQDGVSLERDIAVRSVEIPLLMPFNVEAVRFNIVTPTAVNVTITEVQAVATVRPNIDISKTSAVRTLTNQTRTKVKQAIINSFNNLPKPLVGQGVSIDALRQALVTLIDNGSYEITKLGLKATSGNGKQSDDTVQVDKDVEVKPGEVAVYKPLTGSKIAVTVNIEGVTAEAGGSE